MIETDIDRQTDKYIVKDRQTDGRRSRRSGEKITYLDGGD